MKTSVWMKMPVSDHVAVEAADSSETALHRYQTAQHHILDDGKPRGHCHEKLKSQHSHSCPK